MNKLLDDLDRKELAPLIADMFVKCPEMMARKYPEANVQQAFVLREVLKLNPSKTKVMLCVGCVEDTATEYLKTTGYNIIDIDPEINVSLEKYRANTRNTFDIIFSTSVIEHVKEDEEFTRDICKLLNPGGIAILTCDFREKPGQVHPLDFRFYNENDLLNRLGKIIKEYDCDLIGKPNWKGEPNFIYDGFHYNFATWMFRKKTLTKE